MKGHVGRFRKVLPQLETLSDSRRYAKSKYCPCPPEAGWRHIRTLRRQGSCPPSTDNKAVPKDEWGVCGANGPSGPSSRLLRIVHVAQTMHSVQCLNSAKGMRCIHSDRHVERTWAP